MPLDRAKAQLKMPLPETQSYLKPLGVGTAPEAHASAHKACELLAGQLCGDEALPQTACCAGQGCQTFRESRASIAWTAGSGVP